MGEKWKSLIESLTSWILKAFSAIVPMRTVGRMGTIQMGAMAGLFHPTFFPTSEIFLLFFPCLPPTAYCLLRLRNRPFFKPNLSLLEAILSLPEANLSLSKAILSLPMRYCSLLEANRSML